MSFKLGKKSKEHLSTVVPELQEVVELAILISEVDFSVVEGIRTEARQKELIEQGKSWTMDSYHLKGQAVDLYPYVNGKTSHDESHYKEVAAAMFKASQTLGIEIEWGGFWKKTEDKPHWQLVTRSLT